MPKVKTVHNVKLEMIRPSPHRYSRPGMACDRKLAYIVAKRGQTVPLLVREVFAVASRENPITVHEGDSIVATFEVPAGGVPEGVAIHGTASVFSHYEIIDGHRVYDAIESNGGKSCTVMSVGQVDDLEAIMMMVERNESRTIELEHVKLAQMFVRLAERYSPEEVASRIGWTLEEVEGFRSMVDPEFMKKFSEGSSVDQVEFFSEAEESPVEEMR